MFAYDAVAAIERDSDLVAGAAATGDHAAAVPGCPAWTLRDLVEHLGEVQRFWAGAIRLAGVQPSPQDPVAPAGDLAEWYRASAAELLGALRETPFDAPCWTWWGEPATVEAVARHQVQEAAVHRWDAQSALGAAKPLDPEPAHDAVDEFLSVTLGGRAARLPGAVTLATTDTGGSWQVGPGEVGATVRATASDLLLLLYRRIPAAAVTVTGDASLVDALLAAADTE
jgi:uncharacterized protein (TIGR03083 family)